MPRAPNFFYQDPTQAIGSSLVRAIFGDPQAAAKQRQERAQADALASQAEENRAHARLYGGQATEQDHQTSAADSYSTPEFLQKYFGPSAPSVPVPAWNAPPEVSELPMRPGEPEAPAAHEARFRDGLTQMIVMMARANGEHVDPTKVIGALGAASGIDPLQRTGVIAQGNTPGATFAGMPERADAIAAQDDAARLVQAMGVARTNHASDIPVANIQAGASRYGSDSRERASNFATSTRASTSRYATDAKGAGPAPGFDVISSSFPGTTMNSGLRSVEHNREVGGVADSDHLGNKPGIQGYDIDPIPGVTLEQARAKIEADHPGVRVIDARDERGRRGPNGKPLGGWHFSLQNIAGPAAKPGKAGAAKPPKLLTEKQSTLVGQAVDDLLTNRGIALKPDSRSYLVGQALKKYQETGNPVLAARTALDETQRAGHARRTAAAPAKPAPRTPSSGPVRIGTEADADRFVNNPANKGRTFLMNGKQYTVN